MKSYYGEPTGTFNLVLSQEDLRGLVMTRDICVRTTQIPCEMSRIVWNQERNDMDVVDKRTIELAGLSMHEYNIVDNKSVPHYIQYLHIRLE